MMVLEQGIQEQEQPDIGHAQDVCTVVENIVGDGEDVMVARIMSGDVML